MMLDMSIYEIPGKTLATSQEETQGRNGKRTPTTWDAPAFAANIESIPVPHPTSSTVLSLKRWGLLMIAARYEPVRTVSFNISS